MRRVDSVRAAPMAAAIRSASASLSPGGGVPLRPAGATAGRPTGGGGGTGSGAGVAAGAVFGSVVFG